MDGDLGQRPRLARGVAGRPAARRGARPGGKRLVHAAWCVRAGRADRRPHGLGPERWLARRLPERARGSGGAAPHRRRGNAARDGAARGLGRRGGSEVRSLTVRLLGCCGLDGRPGRVAEARRSRRGLATRRGRCLWRRPRPRTRRALPAREFRGLPRAPHRAGPGARVARPAARRRARHVRRRALAHHVDGAGGPRRLDAHGQAPRRARGRREARARDPGRRPRDGRRRSLHVGRGRLPAGDRHLRRRDRRAAARPAAPRRREAGVDARPSAGALARLCRGGADRRRLGEDLVDRDRSCSRRRWSGSPTRRSGRSRAPRTASPPGRSTMRRRSRAPASPR